MLCYLDAFKSSELAEILRCETNNPFLELPPLCALMIQGAILSGAVCAGRVTQGKLVLSEGPDKVWFEEFYDGE